MAHFEELLQVRSLVAELTNREAELFALCFTKVGDKREMGFNKWQALNPVYTVSKCPVGGHLQTMSSIYKRIA